MEENFQVVSASVTDRGLSEKRPQNEDSYLELTQHGIFAVADGVGGAQAGDVASQMAVEILAEAFANRPENSDAEDVMRVAIERANSAIYQMSHDLPQLATMATTIVALHLAGNIATIGHVGDSRLYRIDSSGTISQETADHSVVAEEVRAGRMTPEQAAVHPSRNVISRALGAESTVEVEMKTIMVEPNTSFILCSDGITRHIDDWELESILRSDDDLTEVCRKLKQVCYDRGAEDNLTAVVVKIKGELAPVFEDSTPAYQEHPEEETVATARSPFDDVAGPVAEEKGPAYAETSTVLPENEDVLELSTEPPPIVHEEEAAELEPIELEIPDVPDVKEPAVVEPVPVMTAEMSQTADRSISPAYHPQDETLPASRGAFFGGFLSSLLLLVLGGLLGAAGMYALFQPRTTGQPQPQPTPVLEPKALPRFSSFEQLRRDVDADPIKYLEANKAYEPDADAADFYLKGRAFLRLGNYFEAKQSLLEARKRLKADSDDSATLETEIALTLAVINSGPASESFRKDVTDWANTGSNTDANSAGTVNANQNINANR